MHHTLTSTPQTVQFGYLDGTTPPAISIASGDTVTLECLGAGGKETLPPDLSAVLPDHMAVLEALTQGAGAHLVTGPVAVEGAVPGDVLQVDILEIVPRESWGWMAVIPLLGTLPDEFPDFEMIHIAIDEAAGLCHLPWGTSLPLRPFMGVMATMPPKAWGRITTNIPRAFGGNMDNKDLCAGATLYLPVFNHGALFTAGDGHACQGDGEVCITAVETSLSGTFRLTVRKDMDLKGPFAENDKELIAIGIDEDLDDAVKQAVRQMVEQVCLRTKLTRNQAYMLASLAGDLRVTQVVDGNKGAHMVLPKTALG